MFQGSSLNLKEKWMLEPNECVCMCVCVCVYMYIYDT